jgi:hypothetical protein
MTSSGLVECDENGANVHLWDFGQIYQITRMQTHDERFEIQLNSGKSVWYDCTFLYIAIYLSFFLSLLSYICIPSDIYIFFRYRYESNERDVILTTLLDACLHERNGQTIVTAHEMCISMHIAPTPLIMALLPRCILRDQTEHAYYFGKEGYTVISIIQNTHYNYTF